MCFGNQEQNQDNPFVIATDVTGGRTYAADKRDGLESVGRFSDDATRFPTARAAIGSLMTAAANRGAKTNTPEGKLSLALGSTVQGIPLDVESIEDEVAVIEQFGFYVVDLRTGEEVGAS